MGEQQQTATAAQRTSACTHPEAVGQRWGDPISEERKAELQGYLDRWAAEADHGERNGPFSSRPGVRGTEPEEGALFLSGADVTWLAEHSSLDESGVPSNLHLEGANLYQAHLEGAFLMDAHLEGAFLAGVHLEGAVLSEARLEGATLSEAELADINCYNTHFMGANFHQANLRHAFLWGANLAGAVLDDAHLEGASFRWAHLEGASLRSAWLDSTTLLNEVVLDGTTYLGDIQWSGVGAVNLTQINWDQVPVLGEEQFVASSVPPDKREYEMVVRAYRQVAAQLRAQGMSEVADRYLYRAQIIQRKGRWHRRQVGRWFGTLFLDLISGYGYKPMRSFITYVLVVGAFALTYYLLGNYVNPPLDPLGSVVFSITSFHGRGFAPGETLLPNNPLTVIAAGEAIIGLLIEITFIATFTQRFFAR